jgi:hypothetical protein
MLKQSLSVVAIITMASTAFAGSAQTTTQTTSPAPSPAEAVAVATDTPIDTVSGFYEALRRGNGSAAQTFIVPEKRGHGNFDPAAMSDWYGNLSEPLSLLAATQTTANEVSVRYHYVGPHGPCDGLATLTLRQDGADFLIERIEAPHGC